MTSFRTGSVGTRRTDGGMRPEPAGVYPADGRGREIRQCGLPHLPGPLRTGAAAQSPAIRYRYLNAESVWIYNFSKEEKT